ncbi:MAG: WecB/TagA/CpsF family glycosyltransferase [Elainellaceae cyanobacterium]
MCNCIQNQRFDEITLLKTRFHKVTVHDLISSIVNAAKTDERSIIGNVNIRAANFAYELPWYRNFINNSDLVFCDGFGVLLGAKLMNYSMQSCHRMTCPDFIEDLARACEKADVSVFLLAGKPGITDKSIQKLRAIAPNLNIDGHHGYFEKSGAENDAIIEKINRFNPDVLYVGFGMPAQEKWIWDNFNHIQTRVFLPLGACLDFYTGEVYRGPQWLTDRGLEWLSRLFTEPQRLWSRYLVGNPLFFYRVIQEKLFQR